jgi:soluble lytic murein transglycosylase
LIRQESQFDQNALSTAGALGLMQLMPATAKETARRNDLRHDVSWLTNKPKHNVQLGSLYIAQMINQFDGSLPLAIAAYNAGPGRVNQWIKQIGDPRAPNADMIDWIESIPVYETRNYVHRVMEGYTVYRAKLARYNNGTRASAQDSMTPFQTAYNP